MNKNKNNNTHDIDIILEKEQYVAGEVAKGKIVIAKGIHDKTQDITFYAYGKEATEILEDRLEPDELGGIPLILHDSYTSF